MNQTPPGTAPKTRSLLPVSFLAAIAALFIGAISVMTTPAAAVISSSVRSACMSDYFAYCAGLEVGSKALRSCMNKAGPKLTTSCVNALVAAGEVSKAEVTRRSTRTASKPKAKARAQYARRSTCISGPARPGARHSNSCRTYAAKGRGKGMRRYATLR